MSEYTECLMNAAKIARWRNEHPGEQLTARAVETIIGADLRGANLRGANLRGADLGVANLWGADLRGANLWGADLRGANLWGANLWRADLGVANLRGANLGVADLGVANLRGANLWGANLWGADLRGANLWGANLWGGLRLDGMPSGQVTMVPTSDGWHLRVGCWTGTIEELESLAQGDGEWPEAKGEERERRRPGLLALIPVLRAHAEYHRHRLVAVQERWGDDDQHRGSDATDGRDR